jgi:hypothetical protein
LDSGAGLFLPIEEYYASGGKAKTIGVAIETPPDHWRIVALQKKQGQRFKAILGRPVEDLDLDQSSQVDLITDLFGAFSYSPQIDIVLSKYLKLLKVGGRIDVLYKTSHNPIVLGGVDVGVLAWLRTIPGIECRAFNNPDGDVVLTIQKTNYVVDVPALALIKYENDLPAVRMYVIPTRNDRFEN